VPKVAVFFYCIDDVGYCFVSIFRTQPHCEGTCTQLHLLVGMSRGVIGSDAFVRKSSGYWAVNGLAVVARRYKHRAALVLQFSYQ